MRRLCFAVVSTIALLFMPQVLRAWTSIGSAELSVSLFGGTESDYAMSVAVDGSGNIYTAGFFSGTADFDPGAGTVNLASVGSSDVFVSKLDTAGNLVWAKSFGGTGGDSAESVAVDGSGNTYTTGAFSGTVDFDPGAGTANLVSAGGLDVFVSKLDASGNFVWAKSFGGIMGGHMAYSVVVDVAGYVYTTGYFNGTVDFDPGAGTANLVSAGGPDVFVSKLDASGNFVWAKNFGGTASDTSESTESIFVDVAGNVYTTGYFNGTVDFDPGAGTANLVSAGGPDVFVSKLDASGNFVWAKSFGSTGFDKAESVVVDLSGNVYTAGGFSVVVDFDPGAGTAGLASRGGLDVFVSKLDSSGNLVWVKSVGGTAGDMATSLFLDVNSNIYTTGYFSGVANFDPGSGTANRASTGSSDVFVLRLTPAGEATTTTTTTTTTTLVTIPTTTDTPSTTVGSPITQPSIAPVVPTTTSTTAPSPTTTSTSPSISRRPSVSINDGDEFTTTELVYVSVVAPPPQSTFLDEAVTVEVSNDGGFKESRTFVLDDGKATLPWRLRSGRDQTFTKVVYVRFNNESGTVVLTLSDDIILDSSKPILAGVSVVSSRSSPRPIEVLSFSGARGRRGVSLVVRGSDTISGVASLEIRSSAKRHSTTLQFSPSNGPPSSRVKMMTKRVPVTTKATRLQVRLIDRAGNHSAWKAVVLR